MTQEQRKSAPSFEKYELPEAARNALHEEIASFGEAYSLPPRVIEALKPERFLSFLTGIPSVDNTVMGRYAEGLFPAFEIFDEDWQELAAADTAPLNFTDSDSHSSFRRNLDDLEAPRGPYTFRDAITAASKLQLRQSALMALTIDLFRFATFHLYQDESGFNDRTMTLSDVDTAIIEMDTPLRESEFASRLDELRRTDFSQQALDDRFEHFDAIAQLELTRLLLHDIVDLKRIGSIPAGSTVQTRMMNIIERRITTDNTPGKLQSLQTLMQHFQMLAFDKDIGEMMGAMSDRTRGVLSGFANQIFLFNLVYYHKGLKIPEKLSALTTDAIREALDEYIATDRQHKEQRMHEQSAHERSQQEAALRESHAALEEQITALTEQWYLSSKARKKMGLADFPKYLLHGFQAADRSRVMFAIPDNDHSAVLSVLVKLHQMAQEAAKDTNELDTARANLAAVIQLQTALEARRDAFYEEARTLGMRDITLPHILPLQTYLNHITSQWPAFEKLVSEKWPVKGQEVAAGIQLLLEI